MTTKTKIMLKELVLLLSLSIVLRIIFILLKPVAALSNDVESFQYWLDVYHKGLNPYNYQHGIIYPPVWLQIIILLSKISAILQVSFPSVLQSFLILVESALIFFVYVTGWILIGRSAFKYVLIGLVLNPISILQICQHGQFDVLVALSVVVSLLFLLKWHENNYTIDWLLACAFIGLGITTKVVPIFFAPLLLLNVRNLRFKELCLGGFLVFAPILFGMSIIASVAYGGAYHSSLHYRSLPGYFGISGLLFLVNQGSLAAVYANIYNLICLAVLSGFSLLILLRKETTRSELVLSAMSLFLTALTFAPGYGPQYVMWVLPLAVLAYMIGGKSWRFLLLLTYIIAIATYTVEYGLFPSHGAFLTKLIESPFLMKSAEALSTPSAQTLLRLPLFILYLIIWVGLAIFCVRGRGPFKIDHQL